MKRLHRMEQFISRLLEVIITVFFFLILIITITLVILRYGFNAAIIGGNEAMNYLFIYTTALGAVITVGSGEHIKISFFINKLQGRTRKITNIINYVLIAFINGVMVLYSWPWIVSTGSFESPVLRIPSWIVQISIPIGCCLVVMYCLNHIVFEIINYKYQMARGAK